MFSADKLLGLYVLKMQTKALHANTLKTLWLAVSHKLQHLTLKYNRM